MDNPYTEAIREVREKLNYYRRQEQQLVRAARKHCQHKRVKRVRVITKSVMPGSWFGSGNVTTSSSYMVICEDCGKVLAK